MIHYDGLTPEQRADAVPGVSPKLHVYLASVIRPAAPGTLAAPDDPRICRCRRGCCDDCQGRRSVTKSPDSMSYTHPLDSRVVTPRKDDGPEGGFRNGRAAIGLPGRPAKHESAAERQRAYRERKKQQQIAANDATLAGLS